MIKKTKLILDSVLFLSVSTFGIFHASHAESVMGTLFIVHASVLIAVFYFYTGRSR